MRKQQTAKEIVKRVLKEYREDPEADIDCYMLKALSSQQKQHEAEKDKLIDQITRRDNNLTNYYEAKIKKLIDECNEYVPADIMFWIEKKYLKEFDKKFGGK